MRYVKRAEYLEFLKRHSNKKIIKVVSGARRSGKSTLFYLFQEYLKETGIKVEQIIHINFEDMKYRELLNAQSLYEYLENRMNKDEMNYIFLDEIQMVSSFERVVDSLFIKDNVDLYITGSNAYFLSGDLATLLSGRYVQLNMLPLSYKEFVTWNRANGNHLSDSEYYDLYLKSSFPYTLGMVNEQERLDYLQGLYSTVVLNDIVKRLGVQDVGVLERILETLFSSIGSLMTINKIKNTLKSYGYTSAHKTVDRYLQGILDSFIMYEAKRYDIHGRKLLESQSKYYIVDIGLRRLILRDHTADYGHILENIVFLELMRRGNTVYVGKNDETEVDFISISPGQFFTYYQVALTTLDANTLERELRPLRGIRDQYPKYLITLDEYNKSANYDGVIKINALDWLMH